MDKWRIIFGKQRFELVSLRLVSERLYWLYWWYWSLVLKLITYKSPDRWVNNPGLSLKWSGCFWNLSLPHDGNGTVGRGGVSNTSSQSVTTFFPPLWGAFLKLAPPPSPPTWVRHIKRPTNPHPHGEAWAWAVGGLRKALDDGTRQASWLASSPSSPLLSSPFFFPSRYHRLTLWEHLVLCEPIRASPLSGRGYPSRHCS